MKEIKAPNKIPNDKSYKIFLAGSIEMGKAENWQDIVVKSISDIKDITILNPRRDDWDSSWVQSIENKQFREQVEWELDAMDKANFIVMYFDPKTQSPITLMELGLHAKSSKMIVCCPEGFWRKGNIEVVCNKYGIKLFDDRKKFLSHIRAIVEMWTSIDVKSK